MAVNRNEVEAEAVLGESEKVPSQHMAGWSVEQWQPKGESKQVALSKETKGSSKMRLGGCGWRVWKRPQLH